MTRLRTCVTYFSLVYSAARILSRRVWYAVFEYHPEKHNAFHCPAESATLSRFPQSPRRPLRLFFGETARPPFFGVVMFLNVGNGRLIRERGFIRDILTKSARAILFKRREKRIPLLRFLASSLKSTRTFFYAVVFFQRSTFAPGSSGMTALSSLRSSSESSIGGMSGSGK